MALPRRHPRNSQVGAPLLRLLLPVLLVLVGAVVAEALRTHRLQARVLDGALDEVAGFAAWRFASLLEGKLLAGNVARLPVTGAGLVGGPGATLPTADELRQVRDRLAECRWTHLAPTLLHFRIERGADAATVATGEDAPAAMRRWLAGAVLTHAAAAPVGPSALRTLYAVIPQSGQPVAIVYLAVPGVDGGAAVAVGFVAPLHGYLAGLGEAVHAQRDLLPASLTRRVPNAELFSVTVSTPSGAALYRSPADYGGHFTSQTALSPTFGGMRVAVALNPELAPELIAGGMPRTRLELLVAGLAFTALLVALALPLARREQQLVRLRTDFTASVSHELRTPLAQILLFAETLSSERTRSDGERRLALGIIVREARRLIHMVENVLHFARSERHATQLQPSPLDLSAFVDETVRTFAPLAQPAGVRWRLEVEGGLVARVDRNALRQILLNLLDNAVKYGPPGQTVTVGLLSRHGRARLWVEDQGTGIPPERREEAWQPFTRLQRTGDSARTGAGLGLAVVRELVEMHHGTVAIEEAPGGGARFVIELSGTQTRGKAAVRPADGEPARAQSPRGGAPPVQDADRTNDTNDTNDTNVANDTLR